MDDIADFYQRHLNLNEIDDIADFYNNLTPSEESEYLLDFDSKLDYLCETPTNSEEEEDSVDYSNIEFAKMTSPFGKGSEPRAMTTKNNLNFPCLVKVKRKRKSTRKQSLFFKSSQFHMLDSNIRNKIIDDLESQCTYAEISKKYNIAYQNLMNWKKKGVLLRPEYDWSK